MSPKPRHAEDSFEALGKIQIRIQRAWEGARASVFWTSSQLTLMFRIAQLWKITGNVLKPEQKCPIILGHPLGLGGGRWLS